MSFKKAGLPEDPHTSRRQSVRRPIKAGWLAALCAGLMIRAVFGGPNSDVLGAFDQANKLYEQGAYVEAARAYENLARGGRISASLYFNFGNALFKAGQIGRAILNYRLAEQLAPRDPDVKANLRFARDSVDGAATATRGRWREWLQSLTWNELTVLTAAAFWIWCSLLIAREVSRAWRAGLKGYTATAGFVTLALGAWLGFIARTRLEARDAVVIAREAVVRYGPLDESQSFYTAHDGAELTVLDEKDHWLQVQDRLGRAGWLRSAQVAIVASPPRPGKSSAESQGAKPARALEARSPSR